MNILGSAFQYFRDIFAENPGIKSVILDQDTLKIVSMSITRTESLLWEILSTDLLSEICLAPQNQTYKSVKCICILKPTNDNIDTLCTELAAPHFSKYSLYFTNSISEEKLQKLSYHDKFNMIDRVDEVFCEFFPASSRLFHLNMPSIADLRINGPQADQTEVIADGIFAAINALQMRPYVRYDSSSRLCSDIARRVSKRISDTISLFGQPRENALLLVLDRRSDPITALVNAWYYTAAVHSIFGIDANVVRIPGEDSAFVFDERRDPFIRDYGNKFLSEVGPAASRLAKEAANLGEESRRRIKDPEEIAAVVSAATQFQAKLANAREHIALIEALNNAVRESSLLGASEVEQTIAAGDDAAFHASELKRLEGTVSKEEIIRLLILFALRYEGRAPEQTALVGEMAGDEGRAAMAAALKAVGASMRGNEDVFANRGALKRLFSDIRMLRDAEQNVLSQYKPLLFDILRRVRALGLDSVAYPAVGNMPSQRPTKVVLFYVGGTTYEEGRAAFEMSHPDFEVVVGGTYIHNPKSYVRNEIEIFASEPIL